MILKMCQKDFNGNKAFFQNYKVINDKEKVWVGNWFDKEKAMQIINRGIRN